ncbi:MAG: NAD(P)-dependent oxidoreductase [Bacteroidia bacterium]
MSKEILLIDTFHESFIPKLTAMEFHCTEGYEWNLRQIQETIGNFYGIAIRSRIPINKDLLQHATNLRFIARGGAGMENIDVDYAVSKKITCLNAPEANRDAVGEHALMMLLTLLNKLMKADTEVRKGIWLREENRGIELQGKTVGIIGFGNMGSAFAKKLSGFDVNIIAYDPYKTIDTVEYPYIKQVSLVQLQKEADIISLHVPLTTETKYMINDTFINLCKKEIYIINTARGKCVNTADLVKHLKTGKVKGTCLDVHEYETSSFEKLETLPEPFEYLINSDKTILTPHIAGWTHESNKKIAEVLVKKIAQFS